MTIHSQESTSHLLQLDRRKRQWSPFTRGPRLNLCDLCFVGVDTTLKQDDDHGAIKEPDPLPIEIDVDTLSLVCNLDFPKRLWLEILHPKISFNNKSKCWKLA